MRCGEGPEAAGGVGRGKGCGGRGKALKTEYWECFRLVDVERGEAGSSRGNRGAVRCGAGGSRRIRYMQGGNKGRKTEYQECFRLVDAVWGAAGGRRGRWVREEIRKGQGQGHGRGEDGGQSGRGRMRGSGGAAHAQGI